jgi:Polysaccharide pyruvyl transferase
VKRIAVFCALPPERNTGMATVDLAAFSLLPRIAPHVEITLYAFGEPTPLTYQPGELPYTYLSVQQHRNRYLTSDAFVFWGDFTHARSYWTTERAYWQTKLKVLSEAEVSAWNRDQYDAASEYVFLTSLPKERLKSVVVFGSTIITNDTPGNETGNASQFESLYNRHFTEFFPHIRAVYFRDALSAARISPLRTDEATLGCDCAFLLQDEDLRQIPGFKLASERKGVGVFFGRSPSKTKMMMFARTVARLLGEQVSWIPWLLWYPEEQSYRFKARALGFPLSPLHAKTGSILSDLSGCKYVITDTYHVCVNAWRMGIPTLCLGEGGGPLLTSHNDKKKEVLFDMYGARAFYVFMDGWRSAGPIQAARFMWSDAKRAAAALQDRALVSQVGATLAIHREMAERRLTVAIRTALE